MNTLEFQRVRKFGLDVQILSVADGNPHLRVVSTTGRPTGLDLPPLLFESAKFTHETAAFTDADARLFEQKDESCAAAARVQLAVAKHGARASAIMQDRRLVNAAQTEAIAESAIAALTSCGREFATLLDIAAALATKHEALYAPPIPDAAESVVDVEVRARLHTLGSGEQLTAFGKLAEPAYARALLALKRDPLPADGPAAQLIAAAWLETIASAQPEAVATLKLSEDCNAWAQRFSRVLADLVVHPTTSGAAILDRYACYKVLKPTGGLGLFNFTPSEVGYFETRRDDATPLIRSQAA